MVATVLVADILIDSGDVEAELAGMLGFERADLELDDDEPPPAPAT